MCRYKPVNLGSSAGLDQVTACQGSKGTGKQLWAASDAGILIPPQRELPRQEGQPSQRWQAPQTEAWWQATPHLSTTPYLEYLVQWNYTLTLERKVGPHPAECAHLLDLVHRKRITKDMFLSQNAGAFIVLLRLNFVNIHLQFALNKNDILIHIYLELTKAPNRRFVYTCTSLHAHIDLCVFIDLLW